MPAPLLPEPDRFGNRRHWALSKLLAYEAELAGRPPPDPLPPAEERFLTAAQVRARYGGVSDMWLWRKLAERNRQHGEPADAPRAA